MAFPRNDASPSYRFQTFGLVVGFSLVAMWLSAGKDLWLDELFTWYQVRNKGLAALFDATATGFNLIPVGHFLLLWLLDHFGWLNVWSARFLSIASLAGGIFIMTHIWRTIWQGSVAFVLTAIMVGSAGPLLVQAVEVRPYAMAFFFSAAALWCALQIGRNEGSRRTLLANALCSFAMPFLSYPYGLFSASLFVALVAEALWKRKSISRKVVASFGSGWFLFLLLSGKHLLAQMSANRKGLTHAAPHLGDLFSQYSALLSFPLAIVGVLIIELGTKPHSENSRPNPTLVPEWPIKPMGMTLSWLAVPILLFVIAKSGLAVVWNDRYVLPVTIAIIMTAAPFLAAAFRERGVPGPRSMHSIAFVAAASLLASGFSLRGANRETPVRHLAAAMPQELHGLPLVISEMNSFFHLLHYGKPGFDVRLYAASAANQALLLRVNPRLRPITAEEVLEQQNFVMLVDADRSWADELKADFAAHGLVIKETRPLINAFIKEFWIVGKIMPQ